MVIRLSEHRRIFWRRCWVSTSQAFWGRRHDYQGNATFFSVLSFLFFFALTDQGSCEGTEKHRDGLPDGV